MSEVHYLHNYKDQLQSLFEQGEYKEMLMFSTELLKDISIDKQVVYFYQGIANIHLSRLQKAKILLEKADSYGDNIAVIRDLACCYYQLEENENWRSTYRRANSLLESKKYEVDFDLYLKTKVVIAKFYEEEAQVSKSIEIYESLLADPRIVQGSNNYFRVIPQLLRLNSTFLSNIEKVTKNYSELIAFSNNKHSSDIELEVEHSLALAELSIIGPDNAKARLYNVLNCDRFRESDKNLVLIDIIEESIVRDLKIDSELLELCHERFESFDSYEKQIYKLLFNINELTISQIDELAPNIRWACYIRLLFLYTVRTANNKIKSEIHMKLKIIIGSLDIESRKMWTNRLELIESTPKKTLYLNTMEQTLYNSDIEISLVRKNMFKMLLTAFTEKHSYTVDEMIHYMWKQDYSPQNFERLRISVHRLNKYVNKITNDEKLVMINSDLVKLSDKCLIKDLRIQ